MQSDNDLKWMARALELAREAALEDEVPVGAIVVADGVEVSAAKNAREKALDTTAHAELMALQQASQKLGRWRLHGCTLYVTLEPCAMCAGAIVNSRVDRVVFGARDPKAGAVVSVFEIPSDARLNHRPVVVEGILALECGQILSEFFKKKR